MFPHVSFDLQLRVGGSFSFLIPHVCVSSLEPQLQDIGKMDLLPLTIAKIKCWGLEIVALGLPELSDRCLIKSFVPSGRADESNNCSISLGS
jgi:hypothetical protein